MEEMPFILLDIASLSTNSLCGSKRRVLSGGSESVQLSRSSILLLKEAGMHSTAWFAQNS